MLFVSVEDFFSQVQKLPRLSREEEIVFAQQMAQGDRPAREALVRGYLHMAAAYVHRAPENIRTLSTAYACVASVEKGVDSFNFLQEGETFAHHLSWRLRQCITRCIAERP